MYLNLKGKLVSLEKQIIMGILNYTEDSFYSRSRFTDDGAVLKRTEQILTEGGTIIDLGAVSTRPGAVALNEEIEMERIKHIVNLIIKAFPEALISVDTWRSSVAQMAVGEGAAMINDISGGTFDEEMATTIGKLQVPYCMMHTSAPAEIMQQHTTYSNIIADLLQFFGKQIEKFTHSGVSDIMIDPGFGFGKTLEDNYHLLQNLNAFQTLGLPILVGISRKSMIYKLLNISPEESLNGTTAIHIVALQNGSSILRVHDVAAAHQVITIFNQLHHK